MYFFFNLSHCVKGMGIYVKCTITTHQIWSCHVTLTLKPGQFFSPGPILNLRKSYQVWGKLAQEQKVTGKKTNWGGGDGKHPRQCLLG